MKTLGIIGGTGIDKLDGLQLVDEHAVETPYGDPSRLIQEGRLGQTRLFSCSDTVARGPYRRT